jgi:mRNA interferase HigB
MRVFSVKRLREFWLVHPDAETPLRKWHRDARAAAWRSLQDVRAKFPHADGVRMPDGDVATVFNIGGNKYRLIVWMRYARQSIFVEAILTHAEYSRNQWKR